jgi:hypothetical protein
MQMQEANFIGTTQGYEHTKYQKKWTDQTRNIKKEI